MLVTNGHVVLEAILPEDAVVFHGLDNDPGEHPLRRDPRVLVRPSATPALNTTILELDGYPVHVAPRYSAHGHTSRVLSVAFSPDGKVLASGSADNSVRLWDVASHREIGSPLTGHTDAVNSVAFSADGKTLASSGDKSIRLWGVPQLSDPASFLCKSVGQSFARDQWQDQVPEGPKYRPLCP